MARAAAPSTDELDARARAAGNHPGTARVIGRVLFTAVWPAQILKVRVDGADGHQVAGLLLSGVKFHGPIDRRRLEAEVLELARRAFAAAPVEEVDVWVTVPIPYDRTEPVSGDYAQPTSRTVFAFTCTRAEGAACTSRLRAGTGAFWAPGFLAGPGVSGARAEDVPGSSPIPGRTSMRESEEIVP